MDDYLRHLGMVSDMTGWEPAATAPRSQIVAAMDHAGNVSRAVSGLDGWHIHSESGLLNGQPFNAQKWQPLPSAPSKG